MWKPWCNYWRLVSHAPASTSPCVIQYHPASTTHTAYIQWGSVDFHRQSLENLYEAQRRTRKLCAVMLDTTGRELMVQRDFRLDERGWPYHDIPLDVRAGQKVILTPDGSQTTTNAGDAVVMPVNYSKFAAMCRVGDRILMGRYLATGAEDSSVYLTVEQVTPTDVECVAENDCSLEGLITLFHTERTPRGLENTQNDLPVSVTIEHFGMMRW